MEILDYVKLGVGAAAITACLIVGYNHGADDVQAKWDKEKQATEAKAKTDQANASTIGYETKDQVTALHTATINQPQELANASKQNGACTSQPLSVASVRAYHRATGK